MSFWFGKKKQDELDAASEAAVQDVLDAEKNATQGQASSNHSFGSTGIPRVGGLGMPIVGHAPATPGFASSDAKSTILFKNEKNAEPAAPASVPATAATPQEAAAAREAFLRAREEAAQTTEGIPSVPPAAPPPAPPPVAQSGRAPAAAQTGGSGGAAPVSLRPVKPAQTAVRPAAVRLSAVGNHPVPTAAAAAHTVPKFQFHSPTSSAPAAPAAPEEPPRPLEATTDPAPGAEGMVRPKDGQKALYYQLLNGLYDAVLILDEHGHVVDCSVRCEEVLGYKREDMWDLPIDKIIVGLTVPMLRNLSRNIAEQHHVLMNARCYRRDGSSFAGEVGVSGLSLTRRKNMVFAIRNIERRKAAMDELRRSQTALEVSLAPTFVCDQEGFFRQTNPALLEAFGMTEEQAKKARFMDILPDSARSFLRASCGERIKEKINVQSEGGNVTLTVSLTPIKNGAEIVGVAGSVLQ
ncbi:MAG: PAS domain-containing protein [Kiritimatiellae bacterium]|nr:PAS domain-containing protein [Kiritimatiellia bacterium]